MRRLLLGILLFQLWSPNKEEAKERKAKTTSRRKKASLCLRHVLGISFRYRWIQEFVSGVVRIRM